jgi:hypothetical protein
MFLPLPISRPTFALRCLTPPRLHRGECVTCGEVNRVAAHRDEAIGFWSRSRRRCPGVQCEGIADTGRGATCRPGPPRVWTNSRDPVPQAGHLNLQARAGEIACESSGTAFTPSPPASRHTRPTFHAIGSCKEEPTRRSWLPCPGSVRPGMYTERNTGTDRFVVSP